MSLLSTLTCGLLDDEVDVSLENEVLKKWGLYDALSSFSDRERDNGGDFRNVVIDTELLRWGESPSDDKLGSSKANNSISVSSKDINYKNALDCYLKGQFCDALIYLDDAFESSHDVTAVVELWTLRAKVMNAVEDYLETLRSIVHVPATERTFELCIEGAKALEKLGLMITAEKWLKTIVLTASGDIGRDKWVQAAYKLLREIHTHRVYKPFVKIAPVCVSITSTGRSLVTIKTVSKGQLLFEELPELSEQALASDSITACAHCGTSLVKPEDVFSKGHLAIADLQRAFKKFWPKRKSIACKACDRVVYCSDLCRDEAWQRYHKVICPSVPNSAVAMMYDVRKSFRDVMPTDGSSWQGWWNAEFSPTLLAKLWATIISTAKLEATGTGLPSKTDWAKAASKFEKYSSTGGNDSAHETIPKMFELMSNIFKRSKVLRYDVSAEDFDKRHRQLQTNIIRFHDADDTLHGFVDKMRQDPKRNKKIGRFFQEPLPRAEFHGLFPLASTINHSCFPNAELVSSAVDKRPGIRVMAIKEIEAGEEITVSYVDARLIKMERRQQLWSRYTFLCQCPRCLYEGDGPEACTHCGKKADYSTNMPLVLVPDIDVPVQKSSSSNTQSVVLSKTLPPSTTAPPSTTVPPASTATPCTAAALSTTTTSSTSTTTPTDCTLKQSQEVPAAVVAPSLLTNVVPCEIELAEDVQVIQTQETLQASGDSMFLACTAESTEQQDHRMDQVSTDSTLDKTQDNDSFEMKQSGVASRETNVKKSLENKTGNQGSSANELILNHDKNCVSCCHGNKDDALHSVDGSITGETVAGNNGAGSGASKLFPHCGRCGRAWYCSPECQKEAWKKGHKKICAKK